MSVAHFFRDYWSYYIELENEFMETTKYVELRSDNFKTYSFEYLKLLQAICSEIDIIGKYIACSFNKSFKVNSETKIYKWGYEIQQAFENLQGRTVCLKEARYELTPFKDWEYTVKTSSRKSKYICLADHGKNLFWWRAYNSVKHERAFCDESGTLNYSKANLKNVLYALSALYLLERLFIQKKYGISSVDQNNPLSPSESRLFCLLSDINQT